MSSVIDNLDIGPRMPEPGKPVRSGPTMDVYHPPIDLHPGIIEAIDGFKEFQGYLTPAQESFSLAFEGLKSIRAAHDAAAKNQAWNDHHKLMVVADAADKKYNGMLKAFDGARTNLLKAADALDQQLSQPLETLAVAGSIPTEVRAHVKSLSTDKRIPFIEAAIKRGDIKTCTSILGAPAYLSGLTDDMHQSYTRMFHESRQPELVRRLAATRKAIQLIEQRSPLVHDHVQKAMGGKWSTVQALRKANSEAEKALLMQQDTAA